jgi:hypothetical protein
MGYGLTRAAGVAAAACLALALGTGGARADGVEAGYLQCSVEGGWSHFFTSTRKLDCTYSSTAGAAQHYTGEITMYGVDVLYVSEGTLIWGVVAASGTANPGELAGTYHGAAANVAVGIGAGANVLVGGFGDSITLQPVSVGGMVGGGLSVGYARMTLTAAR